MRRPAGNAAIAKAAPASPGGASQPGLRQASGAEIAAALENGLICVILLIAIGAALYILKGQFFRLL